MSLFLSCILRVAVTASAGYNTVRESQNSLKLKIADQRGTIFDCNMVPLTNNKEKIIAAVSPTPRAVTAISSVLDGEALQNVLERLKSGKPVLCEVPQEIKCDGIVCTKIYTDSKPAALHLLGYTDTDGIGVSGIQAAYNDILYTDSEVYISYECSGNGSLLEGITPKVQNNSSIRASGVITTLDINIQNIAENAARSLETGAIVIADAKNAEIKASVSRPTFDVDKITEYLTGEDSPLLNRAINSYNVGSVFKPCVAIAGIECSLGGYGYTCTGSCEIIDRFFKCHNRDGHGYMNLRSGLANSCNTYFYNYSFSIGKDEIYNTASSLQFGKSLKICDGIYTSAGSLPKKETLTNIAQLANFSIGQGELLLSPISILTLYCSIASDGTYYIPSVVKGTMQNGSLKEYDKGNRTRVMSNETAEILRECLTAVLTEGTGESAKPKTVTAAGKTATAQTGKYQNGVEICQGWFCGFFPAEDPKYVAVIFSENTLRQSLSCGEIFAEIADNITALDN